jgi:hypothetical protein
MSWTKREIVDEAFSEIALLGYEFDITPEEQQTALRRLDTMMATWEARGIRIGYAFPASPGDSSLDSDSGLPDKAIETVYLSLAVRIAASFGKVLSGDTRANAKDGFAALLWDAARPQEQQLPGTLPRGSGNKAYRNSNAPFFPAPSDNPLGISQGGDLDILPE